MKKTWMIFCAAVCSMALFACGSEPKTEDDVKTPPAKEEVQVPEESGKVSEEEVQNTRKAYAKALDELLQKQIFPSGEIYECWDENLGEFAVYDIDGDGKEELILLCSNTYMAGMVGYVYGYDAQDDMLQIELKEFPGLTFYDNGTCTAAWSHNQGMAGNFWPYTVYQYSGASDSYEKMGMVDAWEKECFPTDYEGNPFPDAVDTSGSGYVYYLMGEDYEKTEPVDVSEYEKWAEKYIGNAEELEIPFVEITEENIRKLYSEEEEPYQTIEKKFE